MCATHDAGRLFKGSLACTTPFISTAGEFYFKWKARLYVRSLLVFESNSPFSFCILVKLFCLDKGRLNGFVIVICVMVFEIVLLLICFSSLFISLTILSVSILVKLFSGWSVPKGFSLLFVCVL